MATLDYIQHYGAVRVRVKGSGNLDLTLLSLDDVYTQDLAPVVMTPTTNIAPLKLSNFNQQRARLEISVGAIDEYFDINQVTIFVRPIYTSHPQ